MLKLSEKRFRANYDVSIYDSETEEYISTKNGLEKIAKRMNELNDENEQLRQTIQRIAEIDGLTVEELLSSIEDVSDEKIVQYLQFLQGDGV